MSLQPASGGALAVGTDLVQIERVAALVRRYGERFTSRVFTGQELTHCGSVAASLAARWAAKEAVAKALGTGIGRVAFRDIEVVQDGAGKPELKLKGQAAERALALGLRRWAVSLSHDGGFALAFVVATDR